MGNAKKTNETAAEDVNIDEVARPIQEPVAPSEDDEAPFEDISDALVFQKDGHACVLVAANEIGRDACAELFDAPITWVQKDTLRPDWELAHITASKLADEGGHSLPRLAKESQTTVAHDNAVRLAWGLARRCRVLLEEDGELIPILEELECPRCRKARRLRESS